ncbi:MAG: rhomboid family intramembrane serine protease [Bacteroidales bacterium]|nr:rhomboid family intramembrane serine protease [Bacteroidales bacterium]
MSQYSPRRFSYLPPVIKNLLIINILVYLATFFFQGVFHIDLNEILGLHFPGSSAFKPYQFITYMFAHGSFSHLFFNMFALWMFGCVIENSLGSKKFLLYYLVCGLGAAATHYGVTYFQLRPDIQLINTVLASPTAESIFALVGQHRFVIDQYAPADLLTAFSTFKESVSTLQSNNFDSAALQQSIDFITEYKDYYLSMPNIIGASGAVYGILLAFGMLFPNSMIYLYFFVPIKAKWFVLVYGLLELFSGLNFGGNMTDNVAHFAHLGGMIFGFFLIWYWKKHHKLFTNE